ncbi:uncharacterized protein LOC110691228 isoform X2 [Chenopodium quinoa]|uniref:uncharacterized protein LOC110691228 isoform X2 n=1 Tax=Chenopodium quinoa TaxID=63459 RepID=UPI000B7704A1|nr:uncharacterized protein LOC110691228 isoform X2 [Chenopodium quinoa]
MLNQFDVRASSTTTNSNQFRTKNQKFEMAGETDTYNNGGNNAFNEDKKPAPDQSTHINLKVKGSITIVEDMDSLFHTGSMATIQQKEAWEIITRRSCKGGWKLT